MSIFEPTALNCPKCGCAFSAPTAETVNVTRLPVARDWIMNGSFHSVTCTQCSEPIHIDRSFLYADMTRCEFVLVGTLPQQWSYHELEERTVAAFTESMITSAPPLVQQMASRFKVATVFGVAALAERLRLWEAGLDEAIIELMKLEALSHDPALWSRMSTLQVHVVAVLLGEDQLQCELRLEQDGPASMVALSLGRYRALLDEREALIELYPALFQQPYVSYRRLAKDRVEPAESTVVLERDA